ncbi:MAG: hypothetical protein JJT82_06270 [Legionellaceae bacterium]|nr:hypothetical protein [Legionellaceae bacterium]
MAKKMLLVIPNRETLGKTRMLVASACEKAKASHMELHICDPVDGEWLRYDEVSKALDPLLAPEENQEYDYIEFCGIPEEMEGDYLISVSGLTGESLDSVVTYFNTIVRRQLSETGVVRVQCCQSGLALPGDSRPFYQLLTDGLDQSRVSASVDWSIIIDGGMAIDFSGYAFTDDFCEFIRKFATRFQERSSSLDDLLLLPGTIEKFIEHYAMTSSYATFTSALAAEADVIHAQIESFLSGGELSQHAPPGGSLSEHSSDFADHSADNSENTEYNWEVWDNEEVSADSEEYQELPPMRLFNQQLLCQQAPNVRAENHTTEANLTDSMRQAMQELRISKEEDKAPSYRGFNSD